MSTNVIFLLSAVLLPLLLNEFSEWGPWLAKRLTGWTARRLGNQEAIERYAEEWAAELGEVPGKLGPLITAMGYLFHLPMIRLQLRRRLRAAALATPGPQHQQPAQPSIPHLLHLNGVAWRRAAVLARMMEIRGPVGDTGFFVVVTEARRPELSQMVILLRNAIYYSAGGARPEGIPAQGPRLNDPAFRNRLVEALGTDTFFMVAEEDAASIHILEGLELPRPVIILTQGRMVIHRFPNIFEVPSNTAADPGVLRSILEDFPN
ncbi:hypothetical protein ACFXA3_01295 [Streptomyces sp. NPDC059456]|uniref:hypothetical protein n=1 Tax=Streptomyces sp. NPDC059456 TaxID=3346838 RepID=UPI00368F0447